ncbi:gamma-glutamyltransferase [Paracoccus caeni]|uniref:Glutathione hydrolase proenzyme n=1 Tax=Paracoccus caeni TaxID=657651 RepID=A0A934SGL6_9RHOB|nr:gamma-glutamyltransferase [Paracoccus caeni]MBK4215032.1 gamma-glutamyltransferase [Paracoccus caeni]
MFDFFSARRRPTLTGRAMIATSHPLPSAAGLEILAAGGNAVDAALAAAAVQAVVDPLMNGIGGDCFALYAPAGGKMKALNGSGRAPAAATIEALQQAGLTDTIPHENPHAVTIPGAISAWCRLHQDHGSLPLSRLFQRAVEYAENGFRVTPRVAKDWAGSVQVLGADARSILMPLGQPPAPGDHLSQPLLAKLLRDIAEHGAAAFYEGATAESMVNFLRSKGGLHSVEDFADGRDGATWHDPISADYRGFTIQECPPNGQGIAALMILKIIEGFDMATLPEVDRTHILAEATKLAYHHRDALVGDPDHSGDVVRTLLSNEAILRLRDRIDMNRAQPPVLWDEPEHKDTIYLCVVDAQGNAVSFIGSIFQPFGSGLMDPATGVLFQSRGASFRLIPGHPNAIGPRKRPMHTIIPGMVTQNGRTVMPFGVMGGQYQATGHAAFLSNLIDLGMDVQSAIDAPRSFATGGRLDIEPTIPQEVRDALEARGHRVNVLKSPMGGGQAIRIREDGLLEGGSDSRKDGMALGL